MSIKFNEDINVNTKYYASVAGIPVQDLNNLEFYFIVKLQFSLFVDYENYKIYFEYLCKFQNNENKNKVNQNVTNKIKNGILYQILNLLAGIFMAIGLFPKNAWFSFSLQIVWSIVAIVAIIKIKMKKDN